MDAEKVRKEGNTLTSGAQVGKYSFIWSFYAILKKKASKAGVDTSDTSLDNV
jgi:hypothetical protein